MAQQLAARAAVPVEDGGFVPSTHVRHVTTACNSGSWELHADNCTHVYTLLPLHMHF